MDPEVRHHVCGFESRYVDEHSCVPLRNNQGGSAGAEASLASYAVAGCGTASGASVSWTKPLRGALRDLDSLVQGPGLWPSVVST